MIITKHPIIFNTPKKLVEGGYTWIMHTPFAFFLISILKPKVVVELGVYSGQSYGAFCQAVSELKLNTRCFGVDTWKGDGHTKDYGEDIYRELCDETLKGYGDFSQLLRMTFNEAVSHFKDRSIDLLHIDGYHTYEEIKNDFNTWLPKMSQQGVVIFHDTFIKDLDFGVWKLWDEISEKYPSFQFLHGCGLGVAAIGKKVNKDFIQFLNEANSSQFYSKLFYSLGQAAFFQARAKQLDENYREYQTFVSNSLEWIIGSKIHSMVDFILPHDTLRRKVFGGLAQSAVKVCRSFIRLFRKHKDSKYSGVAIPEDRRDYYMDTLGALDAMPLPQKKAGKKKCAIFVMVKDEEIFLPIWLKYYSRYIDANDIYVFDHRSIDASVQECQKKYGFNAIRLEYPFSFDHVWFKFVADTVQRRLIDRYEYVIFTDVDEIILPDIRKYRGLDDYIQKLEKDFVRCIGYELIHLPDREKPYNPNKTVLSQRRFWYATQWYNKTLISNRPLDWDIGFHEVSNLESDVDHDLMLIHLHKLDFDICWKTSFERAQLKWPQEDIIHNRGWQNRFIDIDKFRDYYYGWPDCIKIEEIMPELRKSEIF